MADEIKDLLAAIETALTPLKTAGTIHALEILDLGGEQGLDSQLRRIGARPPFMVIGYGGGPWKKVNLGSRLYEHTPDLTVMIGVASMQGRAGARDGLFDLQQEVVDALAGQKLSQDIEAIDLVRTSPVTFGKGFTVYGISIRTRLRVSGGA